MKLDTGDGDTSPILLIFLYVVGTYEDSIPSNFQINRTTSSYRNIVHKTQFYKTGFFRFSAISRKFPGI